MSILSGAAWNDRMLEALVKGVNGGKWHGLLDEVCTPEHLKLAAQRVIAHGGAAGIDHRGCGQFKQSLDAELKVLSRVLRERS